MKRKIFDFLTIGFAFCALCVILYGFYVISEHLGLPGWLLPTLVFFILVFLVKRFLDKGVGKEDPNEW